MIRYYWVIFFVLRFILYQFYYLLFVLASLEKYVQILDNKLKTDTLKKVYAGVHGKDVNDPDLQAFFKMKCWI